MGEYMLTGRYIMVLFALASVFVIFDISVAGVLTFACITGITLVLCEDLLAPFPSFFVPVPYRNKVLQFIQRVYSV